MHSVVFQGKKSKPVIAPRRPGDVAEVTVDPALCNKELNWNAQYGLEEMVASAWKWQSQS